MSKKNTLALLGCDTDINIVKSLEAFGFTTVLLPRDERLPLPIRSHADTLLFCHGKNVFCNREYYEVAKNSLKLIEDYGYTVIKCETAIGDEYPADIAFNCFCVGGALYGNLSHNAAEILSYAKRSGLKAVSVRQGYAKCSTVILNDNAIITADTGIANRATENGISVLKIQNSPDAVSLFGYDYGFIGGACGIFENNIYFTGNISHHPTGLQIEDFCKKYGFNTFSLCETKLVDVGGIIFLTSLF